uniref:RING-type domain-containing protein n=1 Tax=Meloidogyne incognita TaxID=6306 RepID=A0A914LET0_MELIC
MLTGLINAVRRKIHNLNEEKENDSLSFDCDKQHNNKCRFMLLGQQGTSQHLHQQDYDSKKTKLSTQKSVETPSKRKLMSRRQSNKENNNIVAMENNYNNNNVGRWKRSNSGGGGGEKPKVTTMERIEKLKERFQQESTEDEMDSNIPDEASERCCICLTQRATVRTYPCGHQVFCRLCAITLIQTLYKSGSEEMRCIICRVNIIALRHQDFKRVNPPTVNQTHNETTHWRCSYNRKRLYND